MSKIRSRQRDRSPAVQPMAASGGSGSSPAEPSCRSGRGVVIVFLLILATLAIFWPVTGHDFLNYDDNLYVTENVVVRQGLTLGSVEWAFGAQHCANWHPLTWLSHLLDVTLFGLRPAGHHLMNVLFHAANATLLFVWLCRVTRAEWRSALVAALFALHPLHVESVAWVSERKDVLSTFFGLLTLWAYGRYAEKRSRVERRESRAAPGDPALDPRPSTIDYVLALVFFALGLMSKPMLVTWPFVLLLLDYWPLRRFETAPELMRQPTSGSPPRPAAVSDAQWAVLWRLVREKIPFLILSVASAVITVIAQTHGRAVLSLEQLPFGERVANALVSYARYVGKALWPVNLAVPYPFPERWPAAVIISSTLLVVGVSLVAFRLRRRWPFLPAGWFLFLGTLVPVIGIVQVGGQSLADRYMYVPMTGIFIMAVWGLAEALACWRWPEALAWMGAGLVLTGLAARTRNQLHCWQNSETLLRHTVAATPKNAFACFDLGCYLETNGQMRAAIEHYQLAIQYRPTYAKPLNNMAKILIDQGLFDEAIEYCQRALRLDPNYPVALNNLGAALTGKREFAQAIPVYEKALRLDPDNADARYNSGLALAAVGRVNEAIDQYHLALKLRPDAPQTRNGLGLALQAAGRPEEAIDQFNEALRLKPDFWEAHNNLGYLLLLQKRLDQAVLHFNESLRLNPRQLTSRFNLGNALAMQQNYEAAVAHFAECLRLSPDYAPAHKNLGMALARLGRRDEAISHLREALRLKPDYEEVKQQLRVLEGQTPQ
jgi:tetratricopeptide (TPR) repeat protein